LTEKVFPLIASALPDLDYLNLYANADLTPKAFEALGQSSNQNRL
jgi:hypothetical protein